VATQRVIGVDVGGTKILGGLVDRAGTILRRHEVATPTSSADDILATLVGLLVELEVSDVGAVGLGVPGRLDRVSGVILGATNLPLDGVDLRAQVEQRVGVPVGIENDANAAALAEWTHGAGRGAQNLVMLTLGTGVGGGVVIDGRLYRGWAEIGHVVVAAGGAPCQGSCHGHGHLESLVSGEAASRVAEALWGEGADAHALVLRARDGDTDALAALDAIGALLGAGIGSLVNIFDPGVVVVGGGFGTAASDFLLEPARAAARVEAVPPADARLNVVLAELGNEAGLIGAALVAFETLDGDR
jgi:glucokinase